MEDWALVPVRWKHLDQVRALIERLESKANTVAVTTEPSKAAEDRTELLRRFYESCSEPAQRVLLYLARHHDKWILGKDLAVEAAQLGNNNVSPQMSSINKAAARHHLAPLPFSAWHRPDRLFSFMMPEDEAEIIRGFAI